MLQTLHKELMKPYLVCYFAKLGPRILTREQQRLLSVGQIRVRSDQRTLQTHNEGKRSMFGSKIVMNWMHGKSITEGAQALYLHWRVKEGLLALPQLVAPGGHVWWQPWVPLAAPSQPSSHSSWLSLCSAQTSLSLWHPVDKSISITDWLPSKASQRLWVLEKC